MNYFDNVHGNLRTHNDKARKSNNKNNAYHWDKVKGKNYKKMMPRGKVYKRLLSLNAWKNINEINALLSSLRNIQ